MTTLVAVPDVLGSSLGATVRHHIDGTLPAEEKLKVLMQSVGRSVLPQVIWVVGTNGRLGIIAAGQRVVGLRYDDADETMPSEEKTVLTSNKDKPGFAAKLRGQILDFLNHSSDLKQEFEDYEDDIGSEDGFSVDAVLGTKSDSEPLVLTQDQVVPISSAAAAPNEEPSDVTEPLDSDDPQMALLQHLHKKMGGHIIGVWNPVDPSEDSLGLSIGGQKDERSEFRPAHIGRFLMDVLKD
ncbi:hypothetical protein [Celeribacter litoreus]|uniref:hypothetical protein n=1 Tax=Celeribacter litoreus TaxID=2876714 RepID=UPI001CCD039B|nr:hypothetical protein [Celeribacter litoreus]MCA0043874.1 hypothetical protein [Celeribacter litoreus]